MRKAFDANVSRAKPRLRLGTFASTAVTVAPSFVRRGSVTSAALVTTSAKSWSVESALPGTPSPATFAAVTVTLKFPEVLPGR